MLWLSDVAANVLAAHGCDVVHVRLSHLHVFDAGRVSEHAGIDQLTWLMDKMDS